MAARFTERFEWQVLLAALVVVLALWGFIELADEVMEGQTQSFDVRVMQALRHPDEPEVPVGPVWVTTVAHDLTAIGDAASLLLLILLVAGFLLIERKRAAMWFVLAAAGGGQLIGSILKLAIGRERPDVVPHLVEVSTASFPSGHSMMSATVFLTLGVLLARIEASPAARVYFIAVALALSAGVGLSRIYLGVHYPTDVLAGWLVGLSWALLCWLAARALGGRLKPEPAA